MKIFRRSSHSLNRCSAVATTRRRKGIALVEVIVAMALLAIVVSALAPLMYSVSQSTQKVTGNVYRNGVLMGEVNRLIALPYDSIPVGTSGFTETTGSYPHTRTITVSEPAAGKIKVVKVLVVPVNPLYKKDSISFVRTKARTSKYLCTTCQ